MIQRVRGLRLLLTSVVLAAGLGGCRDFWALTRFSSAITRDFEGHEPVVLHSHRGDTVQLTIILQKSPLAIAPEAERQAMARRLAEYARDHFELYSELTDVSVFFTAEDWPVDEDRPTTPPPGSYTFTLDELGKPVVEVE